MESPGKYLKHSGGAIVGYVLLDRSTSGLLVYSLSTPNKQNYR